MVHHNCCPVCYSYDIRQRLQCTDHFKSKENFPVFTCSVCGFSFTQDHPKEDAIGDYYDSDEYISHSDTSRGLVNKIYRFVRSRMLGRKRSIIQKETGLDTGNLLDIGSGTGHFAAEMKREGWVVRGIEINEKARNSAAERFGLDIISPSEISSLESDQFDCIALWHVLEHFSDLNNYITEIKRLLKSSGTCVIALPNIDSYDAQYYGHLWAAFDVPRHLWHFNPDTFGFLFEGQGFRITDIIPLPLDVFYISILSEKYKGSSMPFIKGLITGTFFALKALFKKRKSSSLIYILKK
ncbi:MAG TPA: class I SAM-dependent methyltransferase [Bacteroidales bacterium]|nr:class I SAM-dependent methyltransferase [Bacteroidales bacterium]